MTFVCLSTPAWPTDAATSAELVRRALLLAPRIRAEPAAGRLWADARGLDARGMALGLLDLLARSVSPAGEEPGPAPAVPDPAGGEPGPASAGPDPAGTPAAVALGTGPAATTGASVAAAAPADPDADFVLIAPGAGIADTPIAALVASRRAAGRTEPARRRLEIVPPGQDRAYLAPLDLGLLDPPPAPSLFPLLAGIGIENCGDLAALDLQSVEVRFGAEGVRVWRLARAADHRPVFGSRPRELPNAMLEWVDYELDRQEQVVFIVNSLLATVTDELLRRRQGAHTMVLEFALADRSVVEVPVRCSTATADRKTWLRVTRAALEPVTFGAAVTRIGIRVASAMPLADRQVDLFDRGHATARATEAALAHLLDKQLDAVVLAEPEAHPLPERRTRWVPDPTGQLPEPPLAVSEPGGPVLSIQLFAAPRPIDVRTVTRRGTLIPDRYYDGIRNYTLSATLGPDRVSGGFGEAAFAREYFQGVRADGVMVLLFRDLPTDRWHLAGWWD
ncbi:MAG: hypothetical protein AB7L66_12080 [Gemmatimonadales bacterium]